MKPTFQSQPCTQCGAKLKQRLTVRFFGWLILLIVLAAMAALGIAYVGYSIRLWEGVELQLPGLNASLDGVEILAFSVAMFVYFSAAILALPYMTDLKAASE